MTSSPQMQTPPPGTERGLGVPTWPIPRAWGWPVRGGGRAAHVEPGARFAATTSQACGLSPWVVGAGAEVTGVPLGRHLLTAEPIGCDPAHWLRSGLVSNPGVWVQGQPGIGKSAITKRLLVGLVGFGMRAIVPGDVKGEYTPLVAALGGTVWRIGRNRHAGQHTLNPLDAGPLRPALTSAVGAERAQLADTLRARRLALLDALITIIRRSEPTVTERRLLGAALDTAVRSITTDPTVPDVLVALVGADEDIRTGIAAADSPTDYRREVRDLVNTLGLLCDGPLRGLFDRPATIDPAPDTPALSLDISALDDETDEIVAAAMLCSWTWAATWAAAFTDTARSGSGGTGRRTVVQVHDELWRALRVAPGLVEAADRITRLNRHRGVVSIQVTHSLDDLEALPTEADRAKARGMAARAGTLLLGGMAPGEFDSLSRVAGFTDAETALITSWAAPPAWHPHQTHPGRGRYLVKTGQRLGLPVALHLTPTETGLYNTDTAFTTPREHR